MATRLLAASLPALTILSLGAAAAPAGPPEALVWPFHGTSGAGGIGGWASSEVPIGAHLPFGGMRLGPDTTVCWEGVDLFWPYNHYGGYFYNDTCIRAFSHTHVQGAGLGDAGAVGVMLARAPLNASGLPTALNPAPYRVPLSHATEVARPGYYAVDLPGLAARAELTVSGLRSGLHRYTCSSTGSSAPCVVLVDACHTTHSNACGPGALLLSLGSQTLSVNATEDGAFGHDCGGVPVLMSFALSASLNGVAVPASSGGRWADGVLQPGAGSSSSAGATGSLGAFLVFPGPPPGASLVILIRVGLSHVDAAGAARNVAAEQQALALPFDAAAAAASAAWHSALSAVTVNDVGFTAEEVAGHWAALEAEVAAQGALAQRMEALLTPPGATPRPVAAAAAAAAARSAARLHLGQQGQQQPALDERISALLASAPSPAFVLAQQGTAIPGLGLPPRPRGLPPQERLASFYSSLYHSLAAPTTYSDVDGRFSALDKSIRNVTWGGAAGAWLSDLSLWDVYRSQTPLLALLAPTAASNLFFSMMANFNATGRPPHWVFANCETGVMPGSHGLGVLADFLVKGVPGPPAAQVLAAAIAGLTPQDGGEYSQLGYVPLESSKDCTSLTLDFAFDDACGAVIAQLAGAAGAPYAAAWGNRSGAYKNTWSAGAGAMCPRFRNGTFPTCPPLDLAPILLNEYYTEGDGLQYTWSVPHDLQGLRSLFASDANYTALLSTLMINTPLWPTNALPNPFYWAGNEPGVLAPFQFSVVPGEEWRTQYWVRWILDTYYPLTADGVPGNDDFGELNAWAVWSCLGLYPLTASPGGTYILTSPCFKDTTLGPPGTPLLRVLAHNFSASSVYVVNASLNGVPLPTPFVDHSVLLSGAPSLLEFFLTDTPVKWGGGAPNEW